MKYFILGILALSGSFSLLRAQTDGDFRTLTNGNWNLAATWQVRTAGSWATATTTPTAGSNVYLQAGHTVTLTGNQSCNDFHISANSATTRIGFGVNTLSVNGKLRAMTDVAASVGTADGNIPGTSTGALPGVADWIKSLAGGGFAIVGASRTVTTFGEWDATNSGAFSPSGFNLTITPPAGDTFTFGTPLKARSMMLNGAGTVDMGDNRLAPDSGPAGSGDLTINCTLKSAGTSSTTNAVIGRIATGTDRYCGTVTLNGTLYLTGSLPFIQAAAVVLNGTVVYGRTGTQNLLGIPVTGAQFPNTYTNLTLENGSAKTLVGPITVTGALTLTNGKLISTNANLVTLSSTATIPTVPSGSSFVAGPVRKIGNTDFTFPIGKVNSYRPAGISASSAVTDAYTAEYFNTVYPVVARNLPLQHISGKEYWNISRDAGSSNPNITLTYNPSSSIDPGGVNDLVLAHFNGTSWDNLGQLSVTGSGGPFSNGTLTGSTSSLSSFSPFTFGTTNAAQPLPVSLLHFSGVPAVGSLELRWAVTAGEEEGSSFCIQKAVAGKTFQTIGAVRSSPENAGEYHFTDGEFGAGQQLYRLVLIAASGEQHYSQTLSFKGKEKAQKMPALYPNPVFNELLLQHLTPGMSYFIQSLEGKAFLHFTASDATERLSVERLPAGTYLLRSEDGETVRFEKL